MRSKLIAAILCLFFVGIGCKSFKKLYKDAHKIDELIAHKIDEFEGSESISKKHKKELRESLEGLRDKYKDLGELTPEEEKYLKKLLKESKEKVIQEREIGRGNL